MKMTEKLPVGAQGTLCGGQPRNRGQNIIQDQLPMFLILGKHAYRGMNGLLPKEVTTLTGFIFYSL
jgi:hypothetical protein